MKIAARLLLVVFYIILNNTLLNAQCEKNLYPKFNGSGEVIKIDNPGSHNAVNTHYIMYPIPVSMVKISSGEDTVWVPHPDFNDKCKRAIEVYIGDKAKTAVEEVNKAKYSKDPFILLMGMINKKGILTKWVVVHNGD